MLIVVLMLLGMWLFSRHRSASRGVAISFIGYTNPPNNARTFALLSLSNQDSGAIRWWGYFVEVEGNGGYKAPTINRSLPWFKGLTLNGGESLTIAVGDPQEDAPWRFTTLWSPYTFRSRLLDFARVHKLPLRIGRVRLLDTQQMLTLTNFMTNSSVWLGK
jgi:hypothetical protein